MITIITMGVYILINEENNINDLCKSEEDALLGFTGVKKLKSSYTNEEKKLMSWTWIYSYMAAWKKFQN